MQYRVHKVIVIALVLIPALMNLWTFYDVFHYIVEGLMHPPGDNMWIVSTYSLGLYTFLITSSLLPIVPCLWIGSEDRGELSPYCLLIFSFSLLTYLCSYWIYIVFLQPDASPTALAGHSMSCLLIFPVCVLLALGWSLFQTRQQHKRLPPPAKIILLMQCLSCVFFLLTTYLAFS